MALEVKIKGLDSTLKNLRVLAKRYPKSALRALNRQAEFVMTDSKRDYCPVDTGALKSSGHVVVDEEKLQVTLGYGGPAGIGNQGETNDDRVGYAIVQHERLDYAHTVGEAEYLKRPLFAKAVSIGTDAAAEVKNDIESGSAL
jgi:hypothetical protein